MFAYAHAEIRKGNSIDRNIEVIDKGNLTNDFLLFFNLILSSFTFEKKLTNCTIDHV